MQNSIFLLDAYALIFRAYYAFIKNPRINSKQQNTSAIYGFLNTLEEILKNQQPSHIGVAFDPGGANFRHELFPEYKANRQPAPEEIKKAVPYIKEILAAYHIPVVEVEGYEADDVIGTLSKKASEAGLSVYLMTSDKDYCQLVNENVFLFKPKRFGSEHEIWGTKEVCANYKIQNPLHIIDLLAIWGDSSDNIPGVKGIGEAGASELVGRFGTIENILQNIAKIEMKLQKKIMASVENMKLSKKLATISLDVPCQFNPNDFLLKEPNTEKLKEIYAELEFRYFLEKLQKAQTNNSITQNTQLNTQQTSLFGTKVQTDLFGNQIAEDKASNIHQTIQTTKHNYFLADTDGKIQALLNQISTQKEFCFDTETTGLDAVSAAIVGMSFSWIEHEAWFVPVPANKNDAMALMQRFKPLFENPNIGKIGQNLKFDMLILRQFDIKIAGALFDTMIAHYLLHPEQRHNMNILAENYLNYSPIKIEELIGEKGKLQKTMRQVNIELLKDYAAEDADITFQLKKILDKYIQSANLQSLFFNIEMPLIEVLVDMEYNGVRINEDILKENGKLLRQELLELSDEIYKMAGCTFNISSPKQLGDILFDKLKISSKPSTTSKTEQYSTGEKELIKLIDAHPIVAKVLEFRSVQKLLSTYVEALPELINRETGRIHTSYNQALVATGRLSSNKPNLQNIPIKTEKGKEIRKAFEARNDDFLLFDCDYSQIELRIMAHLSADENMLAAFLNNEDIHTATAAKIFNIPPEQVSREMRAKAKSANFGIIYGISAFGLAENLNISRKEAKELIDGYFTSYPKVKTYMDSAIAKARDLGYVETIFGRRNVLADINSRNSIVRGNAERNAINAPIQGSAADIIKIAMVNIFRKLNEANFKTKLILQVHDELLFDVEKSELESVKTLVKQEMENAAKLSVKLLVETGVGKNWLEAH